MLMCAYQSIHLILFNEQARHCATQDGKLYLIFDRSQLTDQLDQIFSYSRLITCCVKQ